MYFSSYCHCASDIQTPYPTVGNYCFACPFPSPRDSLSITLHHQQQRIVAWPVLSPPLRDSLCFLLLFTINSRKLLLTCPFPNTQRYSLSFLLLFTINSRKLLLTCPFPNTQRYSLSFLLLPFTINNRKLLLTCPFSNAQRLAVFFLLIRKSCPRNYQAKYTRDPRGLHKK